MRILLFGATGPTGIAVAHHVLKTYPDGTLILYVRSPGKLPADLKSHPRVTIIEGQLDDTEALARAMPGVDIVISTLGPSVTKGPFHPSNTPIAVGYSYIINAMRDHGVNRIIALGTASITDPADKRSLLFSVLVQGVKTLARSAYNDVVAIGNNIRTLCHDMDWTIVRVPILNNYDTQDVVAGYIGDEHVKTYLSRAAFAAFVLTEITRKNWIQRAPMISSP